jgi:hypothetical protein
MLYFHSVDIFAHPVPPEKLIWWYFVLQKLTLSQACFFESGSEAQELFPLQLLALISKIREYCDMTPESRNNGVRVDVHC